MNLSGVNTATWVRAIMTVIVAVNVILGYLGIDLITIGDTEVGYLVDGAIVVLTAAVWAWGWWKNNSFTSTAQEADRWLEKLRNQP